MKNVSALLIVVLLAFTASVALPSDETAKKAEPAKKEPAKTVAPAKAVVPVFQWYGPESMRPQGSKKKEDKC